MMVHFEFANRNQLLVRSRMKTGICRKILVDAESVSPGFVFTMKSANKFDDQESLPVPDNHILAIIKNPEEAKTVVETLTRADFLLMRLAF